jgi:hypothetical protein
LDWNLGFKVIEEKSFFGLKSKKVKVPNHSSEALIRPLDPYTKELFIKNANNNFSSELTGIYFTDWSVCPTSEAEFSRYDLAIGYSANDKLTMYRTASVGDPRKSTQGKKTINSIRINAGFEQEQYYRFLKSATSLKLKNPETVAKALTYQMMTKAFVHELGHVAGLLHEQLRFDGDEELEAMDLGSNQKFAKKQLKFNGKLPQEMIDQMKTTTPYDLFSIMHYSWIYLYDLGFKLSILCKKSKTDYCVDDFINKIYSPTLLSAPLLSIQDVETLHNTYIAQSPVTDHQDFQIKFVQWLTKYRTTFQEIAP